MREMLFHGKRTDNGEWVEGYYGVFKGTSQIYVPFTEEEEKENEGHIFSAIGGLWHTVIPESVGQYIGITEWVVADKSFDQPLFEGDIVEVWSTRRPRYSNPQSQYDGDVKVRAVIRFNYGQWTLDYDNNYNKALTKLKGKEEDERTVDGDSSLYWFGCRGREEWQREHNAHYKWHDIVKIGTVFENADLLER